MQVLQSKITIGSCELQYTSYNVQLVCFDVDSTLCVDEAIDELAASLGKTDEVAALTRQAMGGSMKFEDSLQASLACVNVSLQQLNVFVQSRAPRLSAGVHT